MVAPADLSLPNVLDMIDHLVSILCIGGFALGWYLTKKGREEKGDAAMDQINKMATNDLPHLNAAQQSTNDHLEKQTEILEKHTEVLGEMRDGILKLVDRTPRA